MSCLGPYYIPIPPREWSRVQNACTYYNDPPSNYVTIPLINKTVPFSSVYRVLALINKGNVLQFKKNSSQLNKQQIYSKIAKGQWTNRTTTWATQSDRYTNPNTNHLKRVGGEWIDENGQIVTKPACPVINNVIDDMLPINQDSLNINNNSLPPLPVNPIPGNNTFLPFIAPLPAKQPKAILNSGNLLCNTTENICTGETITQPANSNWHPTTDSDVPGPITELYWNERIQTWFPRQRLTMNNSTDKWPYNAKAIFPVNGFTPPVK